MNHQVQSSARSHHQNCARLHHPSCINDIHVLIPHRHCSLLQTARYLLANSSGFGLLEASFVMNARRKSMDRSPSPILNPSRRNRIRPNANHSLSCHGTRHAKRGSVRANHLCYPKGHSYLHPRASTDRRYPITSLLRRLHHIPTQRRGLPKRTDAL